MDLYNYEGEKLGLEVETDKTMTLDGVPADAQQAGILFESIGASALEPYEDDIPLVFIEGTLPVWKADGELPVTIEYFSKTAHFKDYAGIKVQGNTSEGFPKKNWTIKLYSDSARTVKSKHNFRGWGNQNKFVLKANWIDITQARNVVDARLWADVVQTRNTLNTYPERFRNTPNWGAVDGFNIRVFCNGVYWGRYTWNIPKDKWCYNMQENETSIILCGEANNGDIGTTFRAPAVIDGTDWEDELHDTVPAYAVTKLNLLTSFVMNSTDTEFHNNLSQYLFLDSLIDYYIFSYATCNRDSLGKNQILLSYDDSKYIWSAYDLDSIWGLHWDGSYFHEPTERCPQDYSCNGSRLFNRLAVIYASEIRARYAELRDTALSAANIIDKFEAFMRMQTPYLIAEDYAETTGNGDFTEIPSKTTNNIQQIRGFVVARRAYVDSMLYS